MKSMIMAPRGAFWAGWLSMSMLGCGIAQPQTGDDGASSKGEAENSGETSVASDSGDEGGSTLGAESGSGASIVSGGSTSSGATLGDAATSAGSTTNSGTTTTRDETGDALAESTGDSGDAMTMEDSGPPFMGTCTPPTPVMANARGSGPHEVTVETHPDPGIQEGTIFRPTDLGGGETYPIFVWGEGGCERNGLSNAAAMAEIASHGYFVIADGTPGGSGSRGLDAANIVLMGAPLIAYIDWAIAENEKPCSAYYRSLDTTKISTNGFSCGGLMAEGTAGDPRITTWGFTSSGMFSANPALYEMVHTPVLMVEGGPSDNAYENGLRDYENISQIDVPLLWFSKDIGHGGDLFTEGGGDFTKIILAWLNWWLKGDEGATGKGLLVGDGCPYCMDPEWEAMSSNVP